MVEIFARWILVVLMLPARFAAIRRSRLGAAPGVLLCAGALAAILVAACAAEPDVFTGQGGDTRAPAFGGDEGITPAPPVDAGEPPQPTSDADAAAFPPVDPTLPSHAPAICAGGAAPKAYLLNDNGTLFTFDPSSLAMHALGVLACPSQRPLASLTVAPDGVAYVVDSGGDVFRVDLATLACSATTYAPEELDSVADRRIVVAAAPGGARLYYYIEGSGPTLALSDVKDFVLFGVGAVSPQAGDYVDMSMDAQGRIFTLTTGGVLTQVDPVTGAVLGQDATGFDFAASAGALMTYGRDLYFIGGDYGGIDRYDVATRSLTPLGQVNERIVGAAAEPCVAAASDVDGGGGGGGSGPGPDAGAPAGPFVSGDSWIGTYACKQGLIDVALVVASVNGDAVKARFDFQWVSGAVGGSFELTGTFDPATRHATFTPGAWVSQPFGWDAVGMDGFVDEGGHAFAGSIVSQGCGAFSVTR